MLVQDALTVELNMLLMTAWVLDCRKVERQKVFRGEVLSEHLQRFFMVSRSYHLP